MIFIVFFPGNDSSLFEFPWAARLGFETLGELSFGCGGSVISGEQIFLVMFCVQFVVFCRILCSDCGTLFGWVACSKQQIVSNRR